MTIPENDIAAAYDHWSHTYETMENLTRDMAARVIRHQLSDLRGRDVLEIGCGTGLNTSHLAGVSRSVLAVDFSAGMLAQARANVRAGNVRFEQQDIRLGWNVSAASLDVVACTLVLEHVADLDHVFAEAVRVLRVGGEFFVCELHPFRQLQGGQAQFIDTATAQTVFVPAFLHDVSDFVNAGIRHNFELLQMNEWRDDEAASKAAPPRLLSLLMHRRAA